MEAAEHAQAARHWHESPEATAGGGCLGNINMSHDVETPDSSLKQAQGCGRRRQGIGRRVLRKLLEEAAGQDVVMTTITSRIPFYAAEGFERLQLKDVPR